VEFLPDGGEMPARASIGCYFGFCNTRRPHSSLDRQTPDQAYFNWLPQIAAA
jgi:putative transposase